MIYYCNRSCSFFFGRSEREPPKSALGNLAMCDVLVAVSVSMCAFVLCSLSCRRCWCWCCCCSRGGCPWAVTINNKMQSVAAEHHRPSASAMKRAICFNSAEGIKHRHPPSRRKQPTTTTTTTASACINGVRKAHNAVCLFEACTNVQPATPTTTTTTTAGNPQTTVVV